MPACKIHIFGLKLTELKIDKHTVRGNTTILECKFDLEGETLYAVKWYKDGNEFYRYLPKDTPHIQVFPLPGVHVDINRNIVRIFWVFVHRNYITFSLWKTTIDVTKSRNISLCSSDTGNFTLIPSVHVEYSELVVKYP
ncbi:hypothetical protein PGB90_006077 [Kerria lacca]